jgi:hypothetical protein
LREAGTACQQNGDAADWKKFSHWDDGDHENRMEFFSRGRNAANFPGLMMKTPSPAR